MLYTKAAQEITQIPHIGQLAAGNHADFIILDEDIFEMSIEKIHTTKVKQTYMAGKLVFQR